MKNKGFTLIELLVVIAIIALLASIIILRADVLKKKGEDASLKRELEEIGKAAGFYYSDHKSYEGVCNKDDTDLSDNQYFGKIKKFIDKYNGPNGVIGCRDDKESYAVISSLNFNNDKCWCVDWQGKSEEIDLGSAKDCRTLLKTTSCPYFIFL